MILVSVLQSCLSMNYVSPLHKAIMCDVMDLPKAEMGNCHVVVFQDFLTKCPLVFPVSDQKATTLAKLLAEEVIPVFGVPAALLSDRGANLLSNLMLDLCQLLGIPKLNTLCITPTAMAW